MPAHAHGDRWFDFKRRTAFVVDVGAAAATVTIARQPNRASLMQATVAGGTSGTGTVTFTGTVDGVIGQTEVLTFTAAGTLVTTKAFSALSSVTTSGLADEVSVPTLKVKAVGRDGSPENTLYTIAAGRAATVWSPGSSFSVWSQQPASTESGSLVMHLDYEEVWQPREGDAAFDVITGDEFIITANPVLNGTLRRRLWELTLNRRQTAPSAES